MNPQMNEVIPLSFAELHPNEHVLCSVVLNEVGPVKMFLLFGPVTYQPNYIRYHGHLTEQRFILEIFPYTSTENLIFKSVLTAGKYMSPDIAFGQGAQYTLAKMAMNDPDLRVISTPYTDIVSVDIVKSLGIAKHIRIKRRNQDDLFFNVFQCGTGDMDIKNLTPSQWKENFAFVNKFCELFNNLMNTPKST